LQLHGTEDVGVGVVGLGVIEIIGVELARLVGVEVGVLVTVAFVVVVFKVVADASAEALACGDGD
jgi:hypothetical protein